MPRKTRKEVAEEIKRPARYDDSKPRWLKKLREEDEVRWQPPKRIYLQFSEKDSEKEDERREAIQRKRKAQRRDSRRQHA